MGRGSTYRCLYPSAPNHPHIFRLLQALTSARQQQTGCLVWSRLCKACIYMRLSVVGNLSIFNKGDGGQVNCCFSLSEQGRQQKAKLLFSLRRIFLEVYNQQGGQSRGKRLGSCRLSPPIPLLTRGMLLIIIYTDKPYAVPSVLLQSSPWAGWGH